MNGKGKRKLTAQKKREKKGKTRSWLTFRRKLAYNEVKPTWDRKEPAESQVHHRQEREEGSAL